MHGQRNLCVRVPIMVELRQPRSRFLPVALLAGCAANGAAPTGVSVAVVEEAFVTRAEPSSNLDSPAVWLGPDGEAWVVTTGKSSHRLHVRDAASGEPVRRVGSRGTEPGEFQRPNGLAVVGDLLLVVERDNARVQVLRLPGFEPVASFGRGTLRRPYGIAALERSPTEIVVFVSDDYRWLFFWDPPDRQLGERVKRYRLTVGEEGVEATYLGAFGDTAGAGRLRRVESLAVDPDARVLLVADEAARDVKVYGVDGSFTGRVLWDDVVRHEPEGIVLLSCGPDDGYWILADQHETDNRFLVFNRRSFALMGAFSGTTVRNTDGLALTRRPVGSMVGGVLYAVHDDRALGAFSWADVARSLELGDPCPVL